MIIKRKDVTKYGMFKSNIIIETDTYEVAININCPNLKFDKFSDSEIQEFIVETVIDNFKFKQNETFYELIYLFDEYEEKFFKVIDSNEYADELGRDYYKNYSPVFVKVMVF